jgi:hypothetical protein
MLVGCTPSSDRQEPPVEPEPSAGYVDDIVTIGFEKSAEVLETRAYDDGLVLFCTGTSGLHVVDARDASQPELLAIKLASPSAYPYPRCQHLARSGDVVYVTSRGDELQPTSFVAAFDLSVLPPVEVALTQDASRSYEGIALADGRAYVAAHGAGVAVLDASSLVSEGSIAGFENAWAVAVHDDYLWVADGQGGLAAAPLAATEASAHVPLDGPAKDVAIHPASSTAYVATGAAGIAVVDVADPNTPTLIRHIDTPGSAVAVQVVGDRLWLADWHEARVYVLDDPHDPTAAGAQRSDGRILGIAGRDDLGMLGSWRGLEIVKHDSSAAPPDLRLADERIELGAVDPGTAAAAAVVIHNDGRAPLALLDARIDDPFSILGDLSTIEPGSASAIEVRVTPATDTPLKGTLIILSDDPDEPESRVDIHLNATGLEVGDVVPEVEVELTDGQTWRLADAAGEVTLLAYFATF